MLFAPASNEAKKKNPAHTYDYLVARKLKKGRKTHKLRKKIYKRTQVSKKTPKNANRKPVILFFSFLFAVFVLFLVFSSLYAVLLIFVFFDFGSVRSVIFVFLPFVFHTS